MASSLKNLSVYNPESVPDGSGFSIGIAVAEWNHEVTGKLLEGAREALLKHGVKEENILVQYVPGTFELPLATRWMTDDPAIDGAIALGCVIQGETRHFDFICDAAANGIMSVGLTSSKPVIFGVLTTDNQEQALDRAGGKHGNKGVEAGVTLLKMLGLR